MTVEDRLIAGARYPTMTARSEVPGDLWKVLDALADAGATGCQAGAEDALRDLRLECHLLGWPPNPKQPQTAFQETP